MFTSPSHSNASSYFLTFLLKNINLESEEQPTLKSCGQFLLINIKYLNYLFVAAFSQICQYHNQEKNPFNFNLRSHNSKDLMGKESNN